MVSIGLSCEYDEGKDDKKFGFENTELRLGFPRNGGEHSNHNNKYGKRGFEEINVDLKLNLATKETMGKSGVGLKDLRNGRSMKPPPKAQVVGWPPMGSFRKKFMAVQKSEDAEGTEKGSGGAVTAFVKVSVDDVPYLRKVDLKMHKTYEELSDALGKMFGSFTMGKCDAQGTIDLMTQRKLLNCCDYVPTYEDEDGDWMLVGDVPWEMFVESCKRLRIMRGTEATGLSMEKCKAKL